MTFTPLKFGKIRASQIGNVYQAGVINQEVGLTPIPFSSSDSSPGVGRSTPHMVNVNGPGPSTPPKDTSIDSDAALSQRQTTKPLCLLCLDGGGVKGLSSLLILKRIFVELKKQNGAENIPHPCDYFDLIGGTSTGGLIAIMLGRLRMSIESSEEEFRHTSKLVFTSSWTTRPICRQINAVLGNPWFKAERLENVVKELLQKRTLNKEEMMKESSTPVCKIFVGVTRTYTAQPELLRSYETFDASEQNYNCGIWEAARATTAAPLFFKKISLKSGGATFVDGAVRINNPIYELVREAKRLYPSRDIGCIVSVGTGWPAPTSIQSSKLHRIAKTCVDIALDAQGKAEEFAKDEGKELQKAHKYFRFNVEQGLQDIEIDEWRQAERMDAMTTSYLNREVNAEQVRLCATAMNACFRSV